MYCNHEIEVINYMHVSELEYATVARSLLQKNVSPELEKRIFQRARRLASVTKTFKGTDKVRARRSSLSAAEVLGESIVTDGILTRSKSAKHPKIRFGLSTSKIHFKNCTTTSQRVLRSGNA
mmetsp:Transcript_66943/g.134942  ORF Transcript_66943/g.134942 Transcript_66943/m.134942 type:complete len:122 (+) Transcript_66943:192-557(+)